MADDSFDDTHFADTTDRVKKDEGGVAEPFEFWHSHSHNLKFHENLLSSKETYGAHVVRISDNFRQGD